MAGYETLIRLKRLEEEANKLGFKFAHSKYGSREIECFALYPKDDALPIYSRDAELMCGTDTQVDAFLRGIQFAKHYYSILRLVDDKKVERKEQDERNHQLARIIKGEKSTKIEK